MKPLTEKQRRMVVFIGEYTREHGFPPSQREICKAGNFCKSTNAVHYHLATLEERGYLTQDFAKSRSIVLTDLGKKLLPPLPVKTRSVKILDDEGLRVLAARMREKDVHLTTLGGEA